MEHVRNVEDVDVVPDVGEASSHSLVCYVRPYS